MKYIFCLFFLFIMGQISLNAQDKPKHSKWIFGPSLGYQYQKTSFIKASFWGLTDLGYANYLRVDGGANMTWEEGRAHAIPELGITYYLSAKGAWPFVKMEVSPYTVTPKVGVGIFNIFEVGAGYGFDLNTKRGLGPIKGFNISVGLSLPLNYHLY